MRPNLSKLGEIRVPGLVEGLHPPAPFLSLKDSVRLLVDFLRSGQGKTTLLTGAGVSVDSGIRVSPSPSSQRAHATTLRSCSASITFVW